MRNTLDQANSPYLLQHKDNPVHWQQWSDEIITLAKEMDKTRNADQIQAQSTSEAKDLR